MPVRGMGSVSVPERAGDGDAPARPIPAFAPWPVLVVAAAVGVVHLLAAWRPRRWYDEALQLAIGRLHLDWGSVDQPPLVPLLARLADTVAPQSSVVLALPAIAATVSSVVLAALVARELGGDARAQLVAALAQATGRWVALVGHWLTPYSIEPMLWLAIGWLLVRWVRTRSDRLLVGLGLVAAVGAQTKFQVMLFCAVLVLSAAVLGPRALFTRPAFWGGALLALLVATPTLVWQANRGWPQLALSRTVAAQAPDYGGRPGVAFSLLALAGLLGALLVVGGFVALWVVPEFREYRFLGLAFVVLFVAFVVPPGRPGYLAGFHGLLVAFGVVWLQRRREAGRARWQWLVWPVAAVSVLLAGWNLQRSLAQADPVVADAVGVVTAQAYGALSPDQRARTTVMGDTFMYAAYLDTAPRELGLPPAASGSGSYGYFDPPPESQDAVLLVGTGAGEARALAQLRPRFADARPVARIVPSSTATVLGGAGRPTTVWLLTGREEPWSAFWRSLRTVS